MRLYLRRFQVISYNKLIPHKKFSYLNNKKNKIKKNITLISY